MFHAGFGHSSDSHIPHYNSSAPHFHASNFPISARPSYSNEDLQLAGACDWHKLEKLVHAENELITLLKEKGLVDPASKLEQMRDEVLAHRMANSPYASAKNFLRNNCANDAYIEKWRKDIHGFDTMVAHALKRLQTPPQTAIQLRYLSRMLHQQAKASLPFTGYYNPVAKPPQLKPGLYKNHEYEKRFVLGEFKPTRPISGSVPNLVVAGFM